MITYTSNLVELYKLLVRESKAKVQCTLEKRKKKKKNKSKVQHGTKLTRARHKARRTERFRAEGVGGTRVRLHGGLVANVGASLPSPEEVVCYGGIRWPCLISGGPRVQHRDGERTRGQKRRPVKWRGADFRRVSDLEIRLKKIGGVRGGRQGAIVPDDSVMLR